MVRSVAVKEILGDNYILTMVMIVKNIFDWYWKLRIGWIMRHGSTFDSWKMWIWSRDLDKYQLCCNGHQCDCWGQTLRQHFFDTDFGEIMDELYEKYYVE